MLGSMEVTAAEGLSQVSLWLLSFGLAFGILSWSAANPGR
mgnify:CR=1 FL=1